MNAKDNNLNIPVIDEDTTKRIIELCNIILVYEDELDYEKCKKYVEEHINRKIMFKGDKYDIRFIAQKEVAQYVENCPSVPQLFAFMVDDNFHRYRKSFKNYFYQYYYKINQTISQDVYPSEFEYVFDFIQESIDFYTIYEKVSLKLTDDAVKRAKREAVAASQDAANAAKLSATNAENAAKKAANDAAEKATEQIIEEKKIENRINDQVDKKMNEVTKNISETSVTILGIFAGIVLTVVAGLFYSSSVLDNINAANFCRLISISALVGFVCYNLIALMFRYIERIKYDKDKAPRFSKLTTVISIIMLLIMLIFGGLQYCDFNNPKDLPQNESALDVNITTTKDEAQPKTDETTEENNSEPDKSTPTPEKEINIKSKDTAD